MSNYARIVDNVAVDVSAAPHDQFHPILAKEFVEVPAEVQPGWIKVEGVWTAPPAVEPVEPVEPQPSYPTVGSIHFKMLFTANERLKAKELRSSDGMLADFWELIEDPRNDLVNLALSSVQQAVEYTLTLVQAAGVEVDVQTRKAEILTGVLQ